jgi:hypothetical protein
MIELNSFEIDEVSGGKAKNFFVDYFLGKILDWTIESASQGKIDYTSAVMDSGCGTGYCMLGA